MNVVCEICGQEFVTYPSRLRLGFGRFCSKSCQNKWLVAVSCGQSNPSWNGGKVKRVCQYCGKEFDAFPSREGKFCSRLCASRTAPHDKHMTLKRTCLYCKKEFEVVSSQVQVGKGRYCSRRCFFRARQDDGNYLGKGNPNWRGGISVESHLVRTSTEYVAWRQKVLARDNWTCVVCHAHSGERGSVNLHVHHVKPFALYPDLRFAVSNGQTLCDSCHRKTETYGGRTRLYGIESSEAVKRLAAEVIK